MSYKTGFVMDQIAGHVTNYHNLRSIAAHDPELQSAWHEIFYYKSGGAIEQLRERLMPFLPTYLCDRYYAWHMGNCGWNILKSSAVRGRALKGTGSRPHA